MAKSLSAQALQKQFLADHGIDPTAARAKPGGDPAQAIGGIGGTLISLFLPIFLKWLTDRFAVTPK